MRDQGYDPFNLPDYSTTGLFLTEGVLHGLSSIHRTGALLIEFVNNTGSAIVNLGTSNVKGSQINTFT